MSLISIKNLTFGYDNGGDNIFDNVSLSLDTDWKLGLVGRNGKGKTTLLKLLNGELEYSGSISSSVDFSYFPFTINDENDLCIDIAMDINPQAESWQIERELGLLSVSNDVLYRAYNTLSFGEQTKLCLSALFTRENSFLLIDEPTNHLDRTGREALSKYLCLKKGFIIISHDRAFLDGCTNHTLSINRRDIVLTSSNFSTYLENKLFQDNFEQAENQRLKVSIERLNIAKRQAADWSAVAEKTKYGGKGDSGLRPDRGAIGAKAAKMMKRAKVIEGRMEKEIAEASSLMKNIDKAEIVRINYEPYIKERLIGVRDLCLEFDGRTVFQNVSFDIERNDKILLEGKNGSGKSSILKILLGNIKDYSGQVNISSRLIISYVPQDVSSLSGSIIDYAKSYGVEPSKLFTMLSKFGFSKSEFDSLLESFSEGQKKKVAIARSMCERANLYVWDEPLNFIDIITRMQIEEMFSSACSMIFVEHDKTFCDKVASKVIEL